MGSIRRSKTKRRTRYLPLVQPPRAPHLLILFARDLDLIHADLKSAKHLTQFKATKAAEDLPGFGRHYCVECSKWFEGEHNLNEHKRGKNHKRRYAKPPNLSAVDTDYFQSSHAEREAIYAERSRSCCRCWCRRISEATGNRSCDVIKLKTEEKFHLR
jgi:hypothetical protein